MVGEVSIGVAGLSDHYGSIGLMGYGRNTLAGNGQSRGGRAGSECPCGAIVLARRRHGFSGCDLESRQSVFGKRSSNKCDFGLALSQVSFGISLSASFFVGKLLESLCLDAIFQPEIG